MAPPSISVKSIRFQSPPFRKLESVGIELSNRLTLVAGHNGIGKSTILALIANGSGLNDSQYQSYFGRTFQANLYDIIHLDFETEFQRLRDSDALPLTFIDYEVDGEHVTKRCALTARNRSRRGQDISEVRVVPRTDPHRVFVSPLGTEVTTDGKVPLPTIYLGMSRMLPFGETAPEQVRSSSDADFDASDARFIVDFINKVIYTQTLDGSLAIDTYSITGTSKIAKHPQYPHNAKSISLGQDSLSSIATALASFRKLKREWDSYPGGLLVIDELDAAFHPSAQRKLADALCSAAKELALQIVATTHSMALIEAVHPDASPPEARKPDRVLYLADTTRPRLLPDQSLASIRNDMYLVAPARKPRSRRPTVSVYLEDDEAKYFLDFLLTPELRARVKAEVGVLVKPIGLRAGGDNLKNFPRRDPYFKTVCIVLDADTPVPDALGNVTRLPGEPSNLAGKFLSPERTLYKFADLVADHQDRTAADRLALRGITSDQIREHLLIPIPNLVNRESAKKWFKSKKRVISDWRLVDEWILSHPNEVRAFEDNFVSAVASATKATKATGH